MTAELGNDVELRSVSLDEHGPTGLIFVRINVLRKGKDWAGDEYGRIPWKSNSRIKSGVTLFKSYLLYSFSVGFPKCC